uniref:Protein FRA10AC1 n=2 Tax=Opuntia streptacantha TaxID=393608 RepID=A0A7C8ZNR7_OPUST
MDASWEQRLVKRYYDKLFKEYCIADMSRYKSGKIGLRWRTEKEVISGKGQFICGNKHCDEKNGLASYEVNFSYFEAGENKQALIKLVACGRCAEKLHYRRHRQKKQLESTENAEHKRKREVSRGSYETDDEYKNTNYDKRHKSEIAERGEKGHSKMRRERSVGNETSDEVLERSKERKRQEKRGSTSRADNEDEADENFDEYLEGMFP